MASTPVPTVPESYTPAGAASAAALTNPAAVHGVSSEALAALEPLKVPDTSKGELCLSSPARDHASHARLLRECTHADTPRAVVIRFAPAGNAPVLRNKFYKITASNRFQSVIQFLRKELGWKPQDSLVR